jgi:hypothetical protein
MAIKQCEFINENKLQIDYEFYITNQLQKPLLQLFGLALEQIWEKQGKKGAIIDCSFDNVVFGIIRGLRWQRRWSQWQRRWLRWQQQWLRWQQQWLQWQQRWWLKRQR